MLIYVAILVQLAPAFSLEINSSRKNVCRYWQGYSTGMTENRDCWYNPDMILTTPQLIDKYTGDKHESYEITTDDGYILTMYRFPPPPVTPKGVVLMRHPAAFDGRIWVTQGNTSTAVLIWRDGWDVWLSNTRGTEDSERHVNLSSTQSKYWDFTWDDFGRHDVRSEINLIRSKTENAKIYYVGHSLGTSAALVYGSTFPQEARDAIEVFILASTSCYFTAATSPAFLFNSVQPILEFVIKTLDLGPIIPLLPTVKNVLRLIFRAFPPITYLVNIGYSAFLGWALDETDPQFINLDMILNIKNAAWKQTWHILQLVRAKDRFQMYDYGSVENMKRYGTVQPPEYPIWNISVPVYLISSTQDSITSLKDSDLLYSRLSPEARKYGYLHVDRLNHMDYHSGKHRIELYVNNVIRLLNNIEQSRM